MDAGLLADSQAGWKGVVIKMSMSGMCFSSSAGHLLLSQISQKDEKHAGMLNDTHHNRRHQTGDEMDAYLEGRGKDGQPEAGTGHECISRQVLRCMHM